MSVALRIAESGLAPDRLIRAGIRTLNRQRLRDERRDSFEALREHQQAFIASLRQSPIAVETHARTSSITRCPRNSFSTHSASGSKYSCCCYPAGNESLDQAEEHMLTLTCERARMQDGMDIWSSAAAGAHSRLDGRALPEARITAVSNSRPQREFHPASAAGSGLWQRSDHYRRDMNDSRRTSASTACSPSRCSSTCGTTNSFCENCLLDETEARLFVSYLLPPGICLLPLKPRVRTIGLGDTSSPAGSCRPTISCSASRMHW